MATYRMHYKHGDLRNMWAGDFDSPEDAMDWWKLMTNVKEGEEAPSEWVLVRDDGPQWFSEWVTVASHEDGQAQ